MLNQNPVAPVLKPSAVRARKSSLKPPRPAKSAKPARGNVFFTDPQNKYQTVKAEIKNSDNLEIPHFTYSPSGKPAQAIDGANVLSPSQEVNRNLNDSKPKFINDKNDVQKMAYIAQLKTEAQKLNIASILNEAMNPKSRLHSAYSTAIPSLESLRYAAKAKQLAEQKKVVLTTHSLARVLQDGEALTLIKGIKEFCESRPGSKTFLAYDHRKNLKTNYCYNQLHLFRPNSATKSAIQIPLSPSLPAKSAPRIPLLSSSTSDKLGLPKVALKARTVIGNTLVNFDRKLQNGSFSILHTDQGVPINTNALYQAERNA